VAFLGDGAAVEEVVETTLAVVAEEINSSSLRATSLRVSFVARLIMQCSGATSTSILTIWEKRRVLMLQIHMEWTPTGTQILVQQIM
jgi:hypothetical protein